MESHQWILNARQRCDLEMLLTGGFDPLTGFLSQADYENVLTHHRLTNGKLWPMPITLDVSQEFAAKIKLNQDIYLCDIDNSPLARMKVTDKWHPDLSFEAKALFNTTDTHHPGVEYLLNKTSSWYLGGPLQLNLGVSTKQKFYHFCRNQLFLIYLMNKWWVTMSSPPNNSLIISDYLGMLIASIFMKTIVA